MLDGKVTPITGPIHDMLVGPLLARPNKNVIALKVNFHRNIENLAQSLALVGMSLAVRTFRVSSYIQACITTAQIIFFSLLHEPPFNPRHKFFTETIDEFERQFTVLEENVSKLDDKIWFSHLLLNDLIVLKQLNCDVTKTLTQVESFIEVLNKRPPPLQPMFGRLQALQTQYSGLNVKLNGYLRNQTPLIVNQFEKILKIFVEAGAEVPEEIAKDLTQIFSSIKNLFLPYLQRSDLNDLQDQMDHLTGSDPHLQKQADKKEPLRLRNYQNSCYMASVLQSLLCIDEVCQEFKKPLKREDFKTDDDFKKKVAIQKELCKFVEAQAPGNKIKPRSYLEFILYLLNQDLNLDQDVAPSVRRLREVIFDAKLHGEFSDRRNIGTQLDAASAMEFFTLQHLEAKTKVEFREYKKVDKFPGLKFEGQKEFLNILHVPFNKAADGSIYGKLVNQVHALLRENKVTSQGRTFNPMIGQTTDSKPSMNWTWANVFELGNEEDFNAQQKQLLDKLAHLAEAKYNDPLKVSDLFTELEKTYANLGELIIDLAKTSHLIEEDEEIDDPTQILLLLNQKIVSTFFVLGDKDEYTQWLRLQTLPDTLILQFKRFETKINAKGAVNIVKIEAPIEFPGIEKLDPAKSKDPNLLEPGILDLTRYYDAPAGGPTDACYEVASYVVHSGSYQSGHYIAYVKESQENGQDIYWCCDDISGNKEITRKEFLTRKDAYLVVFKKIKSKDDAN